ncbi:MAG: SusC/RagA family TonB-linked outer membrane protein [Bacteroidota bacterium]
MTKLSLLLFMLLCVVGMTFAQRTISGSITDVNGEALIGANVLAKGTSLGTVTDIDGSFTLEVPEGNNTIVVSYTGYQTQEVDITGQSNVSITMAEGELLDEIVVTGLGIKKEKKALGYAVSSVNADQLEQRAEGDVARILTGKAAGVQVTAGAGTSGSATNVTIRGLSSFSGSNQALFIVDGVPFSNDTNTGLNGTSGNFIDGATQGSRFLDLDPNNIESIEILKGLSAATLYGTQGRNGVILITTKAGAAETGVKKTEITVNQSYFVNEIASMPDYQDSYGNGFDQSFGWFFSNWGPSFDEGGTAGWGAQSSIDENGTLLHPYASSAFLNPDGPNTGTGELAQQFANQRYDWRPYNSVEEFFRKGAVSNTSVNIAGSSPSGNTVYNANISYLNDEGFTPGNNLERFNVSIGGKTKLTNKFHITGTMNFARTDYSTPPISSSRGNGTDGLSIYGNVFFTPRSVDLMGLPFEDPVTKGSIYYRNGNDIINPRWTAKNVVYNQLTNRFNWNLGIGYDINDNLGINWRTGLDFYNERNVNSSNKGGIRFTDAVFGFLDTYDNNNAIWDHLASIDGEYRLTDDLGLTFTAGATARSDAFDQNGVSSRGQIVYGVKRHFNYENQSPIQFSRDRNILGIFGQASFDYKDYLYLNLSARRDWVSNFSSDNNSITYPGISLSFLPTSVFEGIKSENGLNFLKVRASYGTSANFDTQNFYPTVGVVEQNTNVFTDLGGGLVTTNQIDNFRANPDLKPELLRELEFGIEARFWKYRGTFDFTVFNRITDNLIVRQPLPPTTGFSFTQNNVGEIQNKGIEASLFLDVIRYGDFTWNTGVNFFTNDETVTQLDEDFIAYAGSLAVGGALFRGSNAAIEGESLGAIVGTMIERDEAGNFVVNSAGSYVVAEQDADGNVPIIGDAVPDYTMNFMNTFTYKNLSFGFQINHTKGGDILSSTVATLLGRGLIVETEDRLATYILPGVQADGTPNDVQINNSTYFFNNLLFGPTEVRIYDASVIRLQEVSLSYALPTKLLDKTPFGSLSISVQGFNLWYDAYNTPDGANFDPNVQGVGIGNGRGFDFLNGASSRRYGVSIKTSF